MIHRNTYAATDFPEKPKPIIITKQVPNLLSISNTRERDIVS
jgi:hypothetical protein